MLYMLYPTLKRFKRKSSMRIQKTTEIKQSARQDSLEDITITEPTPLLVDYFSPRWYYPPSQSFGTGMAY